MFKVNPNWKNEITRIGTILHTLTAVGVGGALGAMHQVWTQTDKLVHMTTADWHQLGSQAIAGAGAAVFGHLFLRSPFFNVIGSTDKTGGGSGNGEPYPSTKQ